MREKEKKKGRLRFCLFGWESGFERMDLKGFEWIVCG